MAGIIAAEGNNRQGITGVMWKASILPLKALDATGSGAISDVVEAMDFAVAHGAAVINCSFGTSGFSQSLLDAINRAATAGVLVVASAGNSGQDLTNAPYYPAGYSAGNLISVAATTNYDQLAGFSNYSATLVQIAAPGVDVLTTTPGGNYGLISGTSAAAPLVVGVAGLLKTMRSWVSAQTLKQSLMDGARKVGALNGRVVTGGIVSTGDAITIFEKLTNNGNGGGTGGGGGGGGTGGGGGGGGTGGTAQLDFMRANRPNLPEPRVTINSLPPSGYDDPASNSAGSANAYYVEQTKSKNATGVAVRLAKAQSDPTGGGGTGQESINLGSQNFNFSAPVLSLNGRAGLGLNLALTYNSKVWNLSSGTMFFNADKGFPGPGWRLGFGVIQGKNKNNTVGPNGVIGPYQSSTTGKDSYIYISQDGSRHDLAKNATSGLYESYDSSYMDFNESSKVLRMMDGTQITFATTYDYQCLPTEIKDRNGNKITITNAAIVNGDKDPNNPNNPFPSNGDVAIDYITDTMGRKIDFYYESNRLIFVRQLRNSDSANPANWGLYAKTNPAWINYATIAYQPVLVSLNFGSLGVDPNINGTNVWVPSAITYPNGNNYSFYYTSYAQMWAVEKWVPTVGGQGSARSIAYTTYNMPSYYGISYPSRTGALDDQSVKSDSPAFTTRTEWAENWNSGSAVTYSYYFDVSGFSTVTDPIGRIYRSDSTATLQTTKIFANSTDYNGGAGTAWLKQFTTTYQDDGLSYQSNVRPTETKIEDGTNTRKTGISYTTGSVKLPSDVTEYQGATSTVYRHTVTTYNTNTAYSNRHIFGLPDQVCVYSGAGTTTLMTKTAYAFDDASYFWASGSDGVIQHDLTNYGDSFITGRANLSKVTQYSVVSGTASSPRDVSRTKHDTQGNVRQTLDIAGHTVTLNVWDNLANKPSVGETHAMVSDVTDPDGFKNGGQYNWYTGLPTQSYHINATTSAHENIVTYGYDGNDRINAVNRPDGGATTRDYWDNWVAVAEYTKIDATKTRYSFVAFDGAGNTRWTGGDHPDGASGKFSIQKYGYDNLGRTSQVSNVTAIDGSYNPIDDDAALGYQYTTTAYDKLDRPTTVTRPDTNTAQYSYTGCGCAGGQTVTVTDERGKKRKQLYDFYGRLSEAHELDGSSNTYGKAIYSYDTRDLLQSIAHYNTGTTAHQDRTFAYDGYGRLTSQVTPEEGTVSYGYYSDDLVNTVQNQKATGNTATFSYNNRHQLTGVSYNDSGATPSVSYGTYDEYGARTSMTTTGIGST
ncbi:MAG: S8 family serine peptidase, partial [Acidobacteriota bacterium]